MEQVLGLLLTVLDEHGQTRSRRMFLEACAAHGDFRALPTLVSRINANHSETYTKPTVEAIHQIDPSHTVVSLYFDFSKAKQERDEIQPGDSSHYMHVKVASMLQSMLDELK